MADREARELENVERPVMAPSNRRYISDEIADTLRAIDIPYIALNPGASYRGFHDSLVNHLGNQRPQIILCLHEEHAIGIAHGYAKVTGRAMAAGIHANIGLMHAAMGLFNAWCDRKPILVIGATGPVDAVKRRPVIDWQHTSRDQGALIRHYIKWDDQPGSVGAARDAIVRGLWLANTAPMGPVYINLDAGLQEEALDKPLPPLDPSRFMPAASAAPTDDAIDAAVRLLRSAENPIMLAGRVSRDEKAWAARVALAEAIGAGAMSNMDLSASFPTDHPLYRGRPWDSQAARDVIAGADVVLSLDWLDLGGAIRAATRTMSPPFKVIHASLDYQLHNGWSMDHQAHPPADVFLPADPDIVVDRLLRALGPGTRSRVDSAPPPAPPPPDKGVPTMKLMASALKKAVDGTDVTFACLPTAWDTDIWPLRHPLDHLGKNGGGGLGSNPSIAIGVALALRDGGSDRITAAVIGDGDFLFGITAIWTAVHYRLPVLYLVMNNRSYFNDEMHQERVALTRDRPVENRWVGLRIDEPDIDIAKMAVAQGAMGFGPITTSAALLPTLQEAVAAVRSGSVAVVDIRVEPGETPRLAALMPRSGDD